MDAWLTAARDAVADEAGLDETDLELDAEGTQTILELARVAAHDSGQRTNAPLLCYLVGVANARGAELSALADAVRRSSS